MIFYMQSVSQLDADISLIDRQISDALRLGILIFMSKIRLI